MNHWVLVDTSAVYALVSSTDQFHTDAHRTLDKLIEERAIIFITNYVLVEFQALAIPRLGFETVRNFIEWSRGLFYIRWINMETHWQAWQLMQERWPRLSFVDATTIVVARALQCTVFTFDNDFRQEGLPVLP